MQRKRQNRWAESRVYKISFGHCFVGPQILGNATVRPQSNPIPVPIPSVSPSPSSKKLAKPPNPVKSRSATVQSEEQKTVPEYLDSIKTFDKRILRSLKKDDGDVEEKKTEEVEKEEDMSDQQMSKFFSKKLEEEMALKRKFIEDSDDDKSDKESEEDEEW